MRLFRLKRIGFLAAVLFFVFGISFYVQAAERKKYYAKEGAAYIEVIRPFNTIEGDFDGETILVGPDEIILVPKVEENNGGWGVLFGGRLNGEKVAIEFSYLRSNHNISFLGAKGEANYYLVNVDVKRYFLVNTPMQPYLVIGWIPYGRLKVKDGSSTSTSVGDARFAINSTGLNFGGGLTFYFNPKVSLSGGVIYRWISYRAVEGVREIERGIKGGLDGSGLNYVAGIAFAL